MARLVAVGRRCSPLVAVGRRWPPLVARGAVPLCVAGPALGYTSTFVSPGRRGTCRHLPAFGMLWRCTWTHHLSPHHLSHTTLSHTIFHHTIFDTPLCHTPSFTTPSFTHHFVAHHLSPHHLSHTTLSHTIFHTQLCHTQWSRGGVVIFMNMAAEAVAISLLFLEAHGGSLSELTTKISRLGCRGKYKNNIERDLCRVLEIPVQPLWVEIPVRSEEETRWRS